MDLIILQQILVSVVLAALVGLEREKHRQLYKGETFGGLRTFMLIGLGGALSYILGQEHMGFFLVLTGGFLALIVAAYIMSAKNQVQNLGMTSEMAGILIYIVGILCAMGEFILATSITLGVLLILYFKEPLHKLAEHLKNQEIISAIQFIIIAFIILPLLPNEGYGPYGFFNPYVTWLMVVLISGLSFASYITIRIFGRKKGIFLTGFLGGFISSTAVTLTYAAESKRHREISSPYILAVITASTAMFFRVLLEVAVVNPELLQLLMIPLLSMGVTGILAVLFFWFKKDSGTAEMEGENLHLSSPFSVIPALKFALFFMVILLLANVAKDLLGDKGLYLSSFLSGVLDVDAITLSIANLTNEGLAHTVGAIAITIGAMANSLFKGLIFLILGNKKVGVKILGVFGVIVVVGLLSIMFV